MNLKSRAAMATQEDVAAYEEKLEQLDIEVERRKELGRRYAAILEQQKKLLDDDEVAREEHQVVFQAALREALRLLVEHSEKLQRGQVVKDGEFDLELHRKISGRVGSLLHRMSSEVTTECQRIGAWGILGQGTGGQLVKQGTCIPVARDEVIGK